MKSKNLLRALLALISALLVSVLGLALAACAPEEGGPDENGSGDNGTVQPLPEGPETGVYYFDADGENYLLNLYGGNMFVLNADGDSESGTYTLEDSVLTLTPYNEDDGLMMASYAEGEITLTYHNARMRFLKMINYTLTFDSEGGTAVPAVKVLNGKTAQKPSDPSRPGYVFIGWFLDAEGKTPYLFDSTPVTGNVTVHAVWAATVPGQEEFVVGFDLGYAAEAPEKLTTVGGKLVSVPTPEGRNGYDFCGWWISMYDNRQQLSYEYTADTLFTEDTTLFALWRSQSSDGKLAAPVVHVTENSISWDQVEGANTYSLEISGPDNFHYATSVAGTTYNSVKLSSLTAGDYVIKVGAVAQDSSQNSDLTEIYYKNKALARVSHFSVIAPSTLLFNGVKNATKYLITVECGNPRHKHELLNNGNSTNFNFANCEMAADGIKFTVYAVADGYASSQSRVFVYNRELEQVTGVGVNAETQTLYWNSVPYAAGYEVKVTCGDGTHTFDVAGVTELSLKECAPADAGIRIEITPKTKGYNSPSATTYIYDKTTLATPTDIRIEGMTLSWKKVNGATAYDIMLGASVLRVQTSDLADPENPSYGLTEALTWSNTEDYQLSLRAVSSSGNNSLYGDPLDIRYLSMSLSLDYAHNVFSWKHVVGAQYYEVKVNENGEVKRVEGGVNFTELTLTQAGDNTLYVRFVDGGEPSEWSTMTVYAYTVNFDTMGGTLVNEIFVAFGDKVTLPDSTTRDGYMLAGWATAPVGNTAAYTDKYFAEAGDLTLFAQWDNATFTLTLNYNMEGKANGKASVVYKQHFKLEAPVNTNPLLLFLGWFSMQEGGDQYTDNEGNSLAPWPVPANTTVYAHWGTSLIFNKLADGTWSVTKGSDIDLVTSVTIPAEYEGTRVTVVDGYAFNNCYKLVKVNIPDTIRLVDTETAFLSCFSLLEVNVYDAYEDDDQTLEIMYESSDGALIYHDPQTHQVSLAYFPYAKTGNFVVPDIVTCIPINSFRAKQVSSVVIPTAVKVVEQNAFVNCTYLTSVTFLDGEDSAVTLAAGAFTNCYALASVTLPSGFALADEATFADVFNECRSLQAINISENHQTYGSSAGMVTDAAGTTLLYCPAGLNGALVIPEGITQIAGHVFESHSGFTSLTLPGTMMEVGEYAFANNALETVTFKAGTEGVALTVGDYAFYGNTLLTKVVFEEDSHVSELGLYAFAECAFTDFTLPATVSRIGGYAFSANKSLKTFTFANGGEELTIEEFAFNDCVGLQSFALPANVVSLTSTVFSGCVNIETFTVAAENEHYLAIDNVLYSTDYTQILFYPAHREGAFQFPDRITTISRGVFSGNIYLTEIIIGTNVEVIEEEAFYNATSLKKVTFTATPAGEAGKPLTIGDRAFAGTVIEGQLQLPERLTSIGAEAFAGDGASSLTFTSNKITSVNIPGTVTSIGAGAFAHNNNLTKITFDKGEADLTLGAAEKMEKGVFFRTSINNVVIPARMTSIGDYAFRTYPDAKQYQPPLTSLTFEPNSRLKEIGDFAFSYSGLKEITIPGSVTSIGQGAFSNSTDLSTVTFEEGEEGLVPENATPTTSTTVENQYPVASGIFYGCTALENVTLPARLKNISAHMFAQCSNLKSIKIPANVTNIGQGAFLNCTQLATVTFEEVKKGDAKTDPESGTSDLVIDDGMTYLKNTTMYGGGVFQGCEKLEAITLPARLSKLGDAAFSDCAALNSITFCDGETSAENYEAGSLELGGYLFTGSTKLATVTLPARLSLVENYTFYKANFQSVTVKEKKAGGVLTNQYVTDGGILYDAAKTEIIYCPASIEGAVTIPGTVVRVSGQAFSRCTKITSVTFLEGAEGRQLEIEDGHYVTSGAEENLYGAFLGCTSLQTVVLPKGLTKIGICAFYGCTLLESINIPASVAGISYGAFSLCASLSTLTFDEGDDVDLKIQEENPTSSAAGVFVGTKALKNVAFPKRLTLIGKWVFQGQASPSSASYVALETVTFPDGCRLTTIGDSAFTKTPLKSFRLPAGVSTIGKNAFQLCASLQDFTFEKGSTLLELAASTFEGTDIRKLEIPASVTSIKVVTSGNANVDALPTTLEELSFEEGSKITALPDMMFNKTYKPTYSTTKTVEYPNLWKITLAEGLESIGKQTFEGLTKLTTLVLPSTVKSIGDLAFHNSGITEITFPAGFTTLGVNAFQDAKSLKTVTFAAGCALSEISAGAFSGCAQLQSVVLSDGLTNLGKIAPDSFNGCTNLTTLTLPSGLSSVEGLEKVTGFANLTSVQIAATNPNFEAVNGVLYNKSHTKIEYLPHGLKEISLQGITEIGNYLFQGSTWLTRLEIPATVTSIGKAAFRDCVNLTSLTFADGTADLTILGGSEGADGAFSGCTQLGEITLPARLKTLGGNTFNGCTKLGTVTFASGIKVTEIPEGMFSGCTKLGQAELPAQVTALGDNAFNGCTDLKTVTLSSGLKTIGAGAFSGCKALGDVTVPNEVTSIGANAFNGCAGLNTVQLSTQLLSIGDNAFTGCVKLANVQMPDTVNTMGNAVFQGCTGLTTIHLSTRLNSLGDSLFQGCTNLNTVNVPTGVKSLGASVFQGCTNLSGVSLPSELNSIGASAFMNSGIQTLSLPAMLQTVGADAFSGCTKLTTVTVSEGTAQLTFADSQKNTAGMFYNDTQLTKIELPARVSQLGKYMFNGCTGLTTVTFGAESKLTAIPDYAFYKCSQLDKFVIPAGVTSIGTSAFESAAKLSSLNIPAAVTSIGVGAFRSTTALTEITFDSGEATLTFATPSGSTAPFASSGLKNITLPARLSAVPNYLFQNATNLETVTFADESAFETIGNNAFENCSKLKSVNNLPGTLTAINGNVFKKCSLLANITLPDKLKTLGANAFDSCASLTKMNIPATVTSLMASTFLNCTLLADVTLNEGLTSIGNSAFSGCAALNSVTIPNTVKTIGTGVFNNCSNLETLLFADGGEDPLTFSKATATTAVLMGTKVTTLTLPERTTTIDEYAFSKTPLLDTVVLPTTLTAIKKAAFDECPLLTTVTFTSGGTAALDIASGSSFTTGAFSSDPMLVNLTLPSRPTSIGNYAFAKTGVKQLSIPAGVTTLGTFAFHSCDQLTKVTFESGTEPLKMTTTTVSYPSDPTRVPGAFANCSLLESVTLPSRLTSIAAAAFAYCPVLTQVLAPDTIDTLGTYAFYNSPMLDFTIPEGVTNVASASVAGIHSIDVSPNNTTYKVGEDKALYNAAMDTLIAVPRCITGEFTIPAGVTTVMGYAFSASAVEKLVIHEGVTLFNSYAFGYNTELKEVHADNLAVWLGIAMGTTTSTNANPLVVAEKLYIGEEYVTTLNITGVTKIGSYAFNGYKALEAVTIGADVESIGKNAFDGCTNLLSATFEVKEGWYSSTSENGGTSSTARREVSVTDDVAANAKLLTNTEKTRYWSRVWAPL